MSSCKVKDMPALLRIHEYGQLICGLLNHLGGVVYIGVDDDGCVEGVSLSAKQKELFS